MSGQHVVEHAEVVLERSEGLKHRMQASIHKDITALELRLYINTVMKIHVLVCIKCIVVEDACNKIKRIYGSQLQIYN